MLGNDASRAVCLLAAFPDEPQKIRVGKLDLALAEGSILQHEHLFVSDPDGILASMKSPEEIPIRSQKARGAFFTPPAIADFLTQWAIRSPQDRVMDPTCGEAVFLLAAANRLRELGATRSAIADQMTGVDLHEPSLDSSSELLDNQGDSARFVHSDFFDLPSPEQIGDQIGWQDAVIGNPPFVRYQQHRGDDRKRSLAAALAQGVRLSGMASSWAASLVHASAFLKPSGRLAMVLPAELLTVHYAEPLRRWLRQRFEVVNLVMFEGLQFADADEQVVLLVAHGTGPADGFCLYHVDDADDLSKIHPLDTVGANPASEGKWSDLLLPQSTRQLFKGLAGERMARLDDYGTTELGTVTGANNFFAISDVTRRKYGITEKQVKRLSPPGTRHLKGFSFTRAQWEELKLRGDRVWLLHPEPTSRAKGLHEYIEFGESEGVNEAYKCSIRDPWWRPPVTPVPDLFFTYMSHRYPRLIANSAKAVIVNSMHGVRLDAELPDETPDALPLLVLNSMSMLGAELLGRSYGGGILKMEPREAASLPLPSVEELQVAWRSLAGKRQNLEATLQRGDWWAVVGEVDRVLLREVMKLPASDVEAIRDAAAVLRIRRTRQTEAHASTPT